MQDDDRRLKSFHLEGAGKPDLPVRVLRGVRAADVVRRMAVMGRRSWVVALFGTVGAAHAAWLSWMYPDLQLGLERYLGEYAGNFWSGRIGLDIVLTAITFSIAAFFMYERHRLRAAVSDLCRLGERGAA